MIKAHVRPHGGQPQMILLGLSEENIKRLKENQPIFFDATPFGFVYCLRIAAFAWYKSERFASIHSTHLISELPNFS